MSDDKAALIASTQALGSNTDIVMCQTCGNPSADHSRQLPRRNFLGLVGHLKPAVKAANRQSGNLLDNAIRENVALNVEKLKNSGPVISKLVEQGKVRVVGGIYRLATGQVDFIV